MALIVKDRVLESCSTSGLVDFTLTGAVSGYQRFSAIGNGNTTYYTAYVIGGTEWEVGIGTVGTSSLSRDTVLSSSTGSKINFSSSPVVWCDLPSSKAIFADANGNVSANSFSNGFTSVTASASLITLTASSTPDYVVTGSGGQTIKLPDATTLPNGYVFTFDNNQSSGAITVNNNSNTLVVSVPSGGFVYLRLLSNATASGSWDRHDLAPSNVSWSTNTFDYPGSITSATWNGSTVAVNRGGTGLSSTPANGQIDIGNGTGFTRTTLTAGSNISITNVSGAITITGTGAGAAVDQTDIGTRANQIPLNQYLGTMAWQDAKAVQIAGGSTTNLVGTSNYQIQPTITTLSATATLTIAQLLTYIVQVTSATAVTLTLPTGTLTDAGILNGLGVVNNSFTWTVINTGSASGAITVSAGTAHTIVGSTAIAIGTSATFRTVKTATNTFVTYRIA
jgi:hypothetical protein